MHREHVKDCLLGSTALLTLKKYTVSTIANRNHIVFIFPKCTWANMAHITTLTTNNIGVVISIMFQ